MVLVTSYEWFRGMNFTLNHFKSSGNRQGCDQHVTGQPSMVTTVQRHGQRLHRRGHACGRGGRQRLYWGLWRSAGLHRASSHRGRFRPRRPHCNLLQLRVMRRHLRAWRGHPLSMDRWQQLSTTLARHVNGRSARSRCDRASSQSQQRNLSRLPTWCNNSLPTPRVTSSIWTRFPTRSSVRRRPTTSCFVECPSGGASMTSARIQLPALVWNVFTFQTVQQLTFFMRATRALRVKIPFYMIE